MSPIRTQLARTFVATLTVMSLVFAALPVAAQDTTEEEVVVTYGGWAALGGAAGFSLFTAAAIGISGLIYAPPKDVECRVKPQPDACRATLLDHALVTLVGLGAVGAIYATGYGSGKLAEALELNTDLGWALAGGYLGLPTGLLLQNVIPKFNPEWLHQTVGVTIGVGTAVGAAFAFRALARQDGQAWPEFGIGAGGMGLGLLIGTLVAPDTVWVPILGGLGSVLGASAAALAF